MPRTARTIDQKLADLEAKAARLRAAKRQRERSDDLRRRVLMGAWFLARHGEDLARWPDRLRADFDAYLTREHDRAAFGLPPRGAAGSDAGEGSQ